MPKIGSISIAQDLKRKEGGFASWCVNVPASLSHTGVRLRMFFRTRQEAAAKVRELQTIINNRGARVLEITPAEIELFFKARDILLSYDVEFMDGIKFLAGLLDGGDSLKQIGLAYKEGKKVIEKRKKTISFEKAAEEMIDLKERIMKRRASTISQIRGQVSRVKRFAVFFRDLPLCDITSDDCQKMLSAAFTTPKQRNDARRVLSGVFTLGIKRGWCEKNPISEVDAEHWEEREIKPLSVSEVRALLSACLDPVLKKYESCIAPIAIMVFAGIRPEEVNRLKWDDINFCERVISVRARASKTGGTRHVTMCDALRAWLEFAKEKNGNPMPSDLVRPGGKNWRYLWKGVREIAGWDEKKKWQEDALRHTYASYHAKTYKDFSLLQMEMGHSSAALLRQRYMNLSGVTEEAAAAFWQILPD